MKTRLSIIFLLLVIIGQSQPFDKLFKKAGGEKLSKLNEMVYQFYGLSKEEIKIVEGME